jgi:GDP-L-fucose synthase
MHAYDSNEPINIGIGCDWSIAELAALVKEAVGYNGELRFDPSKPDGMPAKLLDSSKLRDLGWKASTSIREALAVTYQWFLQREESGERGDVRAIL